MSKKKPQHPADRFLARLRKMTHKQRVKLLIDSGVIDKDGNLHPDFKPAK